jgi:glyoxylase-like metal-dependent hydrolase (beta-lactamase superfamily II)
VDTRQHGLPRRCAAYLVGEDPLALIQTGTSRTASILLEATENRNVAYIFLTHIHLDHAGGAGLLAADHPEATVVAHPRAIRHLADPRRLTQGVREAGPALYPLYGEPVPIPHTRLHAADDGETFELGGGGFLQAVHAPGHAPHHACFFEPAGRVLFTGDAVGNHGIPPDVPLTVPPRFDVDAARETLRRLRSMRPAVLAFTHFGLATEPPDQLFDQYESSIENWFDRIRRLRTSYAPDDVVDAVLNEPRYRSLQRPDRLLIEMCVRGALMTLERSEPDATRRESR